MAFRFRFRSRVSRPLIFTITVASLVLVTAVVYALLPASKSEPVAQALSTDIKLPQTKDPGLKLAAVRVDSPGGQPPLKFTTPTTKPSAARTDLAAPASPPTSPTAPMPAASARQTSPAAPVQLPGGPLAAPVAASTAEPKSLIEEADVKRRADDLLGARKLLVDALETKKLSAADHDDVLRRLSEINESVVFSNRKFISDPLAAAHVVKPGELMTKIAQQYDVTWKFIGRLNGISDPRKLQSGKTLKIVRGPFHAVVNKTDFTLDVYIGKPAEPGSVFVKRFRVGLGENDSTPTGVWNIDTKLENPRYYNPRSDGPRVIEPDDPKNPLGERWIALTGASGQAVGKTSYGIHGTIEPASIGQRKSMGCIRMLNEDIELVYDMLITGKSTVTVVD
ncbi:MAG: L,D-transpeptidase family protein [Burkholderiales bacterium]|nr:L,D-transpeptidase family protein [Phycisphaerae bacterium]